MSDSETNLRTLRLKSDKTTIQQQVGGCQGSYKKEKNVFWGLTMWCANIDGFNIFKLFPGTFYKLSFDTRLWN